jgi:hypothetical protein
MAAITGIDEISLLVLEHLSKGIRVKDIPSMFPITLDQAKRLSRYSHILEKAKTHLQPSEVEKIRLFGIKILFLSPLFKVEDWEGITEILSSVDKETKRDEFPKLIQALQEKRQRIREFQQEAESKLNLLERKEGDLQRLEEDIRETHQRAKEEIAFLNKYPDTVHTFLIKHLGVYNEKLVLARRLDSRWQKSLKKKDMLFFEEFVWYVKDLDGVVEDYLKRVNRKVPLGTEWDYDKEEKRNQNSDYHTPYNPEYRLPKGLAVDFRSMLEGIEEKISQVKKERESINKEMRELRKTSPKTFIESIQASNVLSAHELRIHGEMQERALKWLFNRGYIVASEVTLPHLKRADIIGYNEEGRIIIIEVKVSAADFRQDQKWTSYLEYCDEFYFFLNDEARKVYYQKEYKGVGLLKKTKNNIKVAHAHTLEHTVKDRSKLQFMINKVLSKKYVYGY